MQAWLGLEIFIWSFTCTYSNPFNFYIFNPLKTKGMNKKLDIENSEDKQRVISEKTSSPAVSLQAAFSSEGPQLCEHAWVLDILEASLEALLLERPSSLISAHCLLCVRLHNSAPFPLSTFHFSHWSSIY